MVFWRNIIFFGVCVFSSLAMGKFKVGTRCEMEKKVMVEVPGENRKAELLFRLKFLPGEVIVPQATFRSSDQSLLRVFLQWKDAISTYGYINPKKCRTERWTEQKCIRHCNRDALYTKASACQTRYFKRYSKAKSPSEKTRIMDAMASRCNVPDAKFKTIHKKKTHCWHTGREKFYKFSSLHLNTISQEQNEKFWFPQKTSGLFELKPLGFLRSTHFVSLMLSQDQVHIGAHWKNGAQSSVLVTLDGVHSSIKKIAKTCFAETSRRFMNTSVRQKNSTAYGLLDYANVPNELPSKMRLGLQKKWKSMSLKDSQKLMIEISRHLRSQKKIVKKILKLMSKRVDYYYLDTQRKRKLVSRWSEKKKRNIKVYQYQTKKTVKKTKRKLVNLIKRYQTLFRSVNQLYAEILELRGTRDRKQKGVLAKLKQRKLTIEKSIETLEKVLIYQVDHEQKMTKSSVDSLNRKLKPHLNALLDFDVQIKSSEERALKNQEKIENLKEKLEEYNSWLKTQSKRASKEQSIVGEPMNYREIQQVHGWQKQRWQKYQWSVELKKSVEAVIASLGQLQKKEEVVATHYGEYVKVLSLVSKVQAEIQVLQKKKRSVFEKKMSQALLNAFDNLHDLYERGEENSRPSSSRSFSGEKVWIKKQLAALNQKVQKKFAEVSSPEEKLYAQLVCANEALGRSHCLSIQEIGSRRQRLWFFKSLPEEGEGGRRELLSTIGVNAGAVIWDKQVSKVEHLDVAVEKAMKSIDHNQIQKWWVEKEYWAWKLRVASMENRVLRDYSRQHPSSNISRNNFRFSAELYEYYMNKYKRFFQSIDKKEARKLSQQQHLQKVLRDKLSVYESVWQDYKSLSDQIVEGVGRKVKRLARLAQAPSLLSRCEGASFNHLNEAEKCQKQGKRMLPELERFSAKIYHQYYEMTLVLLMSTLHEVESLKTEAVLIQSEITNRKKIRSQYVELNNLKGLRNIKKSLEAYLDKVKQQIELNEDAKALQEKGLKSVVARIDKKTKIYSELKKKLHERLSYMKKNQQVMTRSCKDVHQLYMSRDAEHDKLYQQLPFFVEKESLPRSYCKFDLVTPMGWVFE